MKKIKIVLAALLVAATLCSFGAFVFASDDAGTSLSFGDTAVLTVDVTDDTLLYENSGSNKSETNRWADCSAYFTYKIAVPETRSMFMQTVCDGGDARLVCVSTDNVNWTEVLSPSVSLAYKWEDGAAFIKLDEFLSGEYVYVRFSDATPETGFGSSVSLLRFYMTKRTLTFDDNGEISVDLSDETLLFNAGNSYLSGSNTRVADNTEFVYKIAVPETKSIVASFKDHGRDRILRVGSDLSALTTIETVAQSADAKVDLTPYCNGQYVYVAFGDSNYLSDGTADGCGSNVEYLRFCRMKNVIDFGDADSVTADVTVNNNMWEDNGSAVGGSNNRFADNDRYFVYKFRMPDPDKYEYVLTANCDGGSGRCVLVSGDGENYVERLSQKNGVFDADSWGDGTVGNYKVSKHVSDGYLYVKFADQTPEDGSGTSITVLGASRTKKILNTVLSFGESDKITVDVTDDWQLFENNGSVVNFEGGYRFADMTATFTYKVAVPDTKSMYMQTETGNGRKIEISTDNTAWITIFDETLNPQKLPETWDNGGSFVLDEYLTSEFLYVRFCDNTPADGFGGWVKKLEFIKTAAGYTFELKEGAVAVNVTDNAKLFRNGFSLMGENNRFADERRYFVYRVKMPENAEKYAIGMKANCDGNDRFIQLSSDDKNYKTVLSQNNAIFPDWDYGFSFDEYVGSEYVYIRFADEKTEDGFGTSLTSLEFFVTKKFVPYTIDPAGGTFVVNLTDNEQLYENGGSIVGGVNNRFADGENYFVYRVKVQAGRSVYMTLSCEGVNASVLVSSDGENYTELEMPVSCTLRDYCTGEYVYVKFTGKTGTAGFGADVRSLEFSDEERVEPHVFEFGNKSVIEVDLTDANLIFKDAGSVLAAGGNRFVDCTGYFIYAVKVPNKKFIRMEVHCEGVDRLIKVSNDGENWTELLGYTATPDYWNGATAIYNLDYFCTADNVYVMFADRKTEDGFGSDLRALAFYSVDGEEDFSGSLVWEIKPVSEKYIESGSSELHYKNGAYRVIKTQLTYGFPLQGDYEFMYARVQSFGNGKVLYSFNGQDFTEFRQTNIQFELADGVKYYYIPLSSGENFYIRFEGDEQGMELYSLTVFCQPFLDTQVPHDGDFISSVDTMYAEDAESHLVRELSKFSGELSFNKSWCFFDQSDYGTFKFAYAENAVSVRLVATLRYGFRISASADGKKFCDLAIAALASTRHQDVIDNTGVYQFDLTPYITDSGFVYVRLGDCTADYGWGGSFTEMSVISLTNGESESKEIFTDGKLNAHIDVSDTGYLYENNLSYQDYLGRAVKNNGYFTYKFALENDADSFYIAFNGNATLKVLISSDGTEYSSIPDMYLLNTYVGDGSATTYNLSEYLSRSKTFYVRFTDGNTIDDESSVLYSLYAGYNRTSLSSRGGDEYEDRIDHAFLTSTSSENDYLVNPDEKNVETGDRYWGIIDKEFNYRAKGIYKFTYAETANALKLTASVSGSYVLSVSKDGIKWIDIAVAAQQYYSPFIWSDSQREIYTDVSFLMENNEQRTVYVRISDMVDDNAYGARLKGMGLTEMSGKKVEKTPDSSMIDDASCMSSLNAENFALFGLVLFGFAVAIKKKNN